MAGIIPTGQDEAATFSGERLRRLREEGGLSREALALAVRRSYPSIKLYERGEVVPPGRVLARLAAALGCEVGDLFEAEGD